LNRKKGGMAVSVVWRLANLLKLTSELEWLGKEPLPHGKVQNHHERMARKIDEGPLVDGFKMMMHPCRFGGLGVG